MLSKLERDYLRELAEDTIVKSQVSTTSSTSTPSSASTLPSVEAVLPTKKNPVIPGSPELSSSSSEDEAPSRMEGMQFSAEQLVRTTKEIYYIRHIGRLIKKRYGNNEDLASRIRLYCYELEKKLPIFDSGWTKMYDRMKCYLLSTDIYTEKEIKAQLSKSHQQLGEEAGIVSADKIIEIKEEFQEERKEFQAEREEFQEKRKEFQEERKEFQTTLAAMLPFIMSVPQDKREALLQSNPMLSNAYSKYIASASPTCSPSTASSSSTSSPVYSPSPMPTSVPTLTPSPSSLDFTGGTVFSTTPPTPSLATQSLPSTGSGGKHPTSSTVEGGSVKKKAKKTTETDVVMTESPISEFTPAPSPASTNSPPSSSSPPSSP